MFTGLVEGQGVVESLVPEQDALRLTIRMPDVVRELAPGESVAINGCCLTVIDPAPTALRATFQAGSETLSKTSLGRLRVGATVNIERSLPVNGRLGGHVVQGHVDGIGEVIGIRHEGEWVFMTFRLPEPLMRYLVPKGSIAIDGISLTVVSIDRDTFNVALIPHTLDVTTLGQRAVGDVVNIETDILGKYVERLLACAGTIPSEPR